MLEHPALKVFGSLSLQERLFVRARLFSAPLAELARRAPSGRIVDVGCGHGLLTALLAAERPDRQVLGIDPDPRKIEWARQGPGRLPNVELRVAAIEEVAETGSFDAVVVADVLYLLPFAAWKPFLCRARELLRPAGLLLLKESEGDRSWKHAKSVIQERVMVHLLRRTRSSGGITFQPRTATADLLTDCGFLVKEIVPLDQGYSTPHVLFVATPRP